MAEINLELFGRLVAQLACRRDARVSDILSDLGIDAEALRVAEGGFRDQLLALALVEAQAGDIAQAR